MSHCNYWELFLQAVAISAQIARRQKMHNEKEISRKGASHGMPCNYQAA